MISIMRIALLIDKYGGRSIGGGEVHVRYLKKYLEKNHNCTCKIYSQPKDALWARLLWDFWIMPVIILDHIRNKIDILHSHGFSSGPVAFLLGKLLDIPVIHTVHGSHQMDLNDKSIKGQLEKIFLTQIPYDLAISVSRSFRQYKSNTKKIEIITNGVELAGKNRKRSQSTKGTRTIQLLTVSRLEHQKGVDLLIKAINQIKDKMPPFQLTIIGNGSQRNNYELQITKYKLEDNIKLVGKKTGEDLKNEYQNADLFILPSRAEGQPIVILEAWAHQLPVIATKVGHNPYMIKEDQTGWLASPNSVKSLEKTIRKALKQTSKWKTIGKNGYNQVQKHYTWDTISEKINKIYHSLL